MMLSESYRYANCNETGGILIGPKNHTGIVTDVVASSHYAERQSWTYFQTEEDIDLLNMKLRIFQSRGYDFIGYWHKHPTGLSRLSNGDLATCEEILKSPDYHINNMLLMSIITETKDSKFPLFNYVVSLDKQAKLIVREAGFRVLPKKCIEECMDCFGGQENEGNDTGQDSKPSFTEDRTVRAERGREDNNQFSDTEKRPLQCGFVSSLEAARRESGISVFLNE